MPTPDIDYPALAIEELDDVIRAAIAEKERRSRLDTAVEQVAETARRFVEDGGDRAVLVAAVESADVGE